VNNEFDWEKPNPAEEEARIISEGIWRAPPNSPVKNLFRVMLWFLPSGFVVLTGICIEYIDRKYSSVDYFEIISLMLICAFTVVTGWYSALLSEHALREIHGVINHATKFV
jgi:hypothetical protein